MNYPSYRVGDFYWDETNNILWCCKAAGYSKNSGQSPTALWAPCGGIPWQNPKELDPTENVAANTFVYLSPHSPLVTTGLVDLVLGTLTLARPGIWQAVQAVPKQTLAGAYNVPQVPLPGAGSAPSGSPLKGDADGPNVFWILWCPTVYC
jgi:hypothetical protein